MGSVLAKPVDARSTLLESIKQKNINLKSAKDRQLADKKEESQAAQSVASILSRRIAIIGDSESEGEDEEEEGWD